MKSAFACPSCGADSWINLREQTNHVRDCKIIDAGLAAQDGADEREVEVLALEALLKGE